MSLARATGVFSEEEIRAVANTARLQREIENLNDSAIDGEVPSWYAYEQIGIMEHELDMLICKIDE